jgi:alkanesulfonate monooxygenase SsuD/methylene tetrahydromethanopterin reductase-like flavin-dependent oxidoreductase (luciferase family)
VEAGSSERGNLLKLVEEKMKSSLVYSYQIEHDDGYRTFAESIEQMELAERYGFDTVLISEHHLVDNGYFPAPFVTLGAAAMKTSKLRLGSGIIILPLYDPLHVAEHGAVLDVISNGRFTLGVGQGYRQEEFDAFKISLKQRPGRTREGIEAIRALWTQPVANYKGKYFNYENVMLRPQPKQKPGPPIWVAAKIKPAVELTAQVGETWFADPITPLTVMKQRMVDYKAVLKNKGKPTSGFDFPLMREVYCAESDEKAWAEAREPILYIYKEYLMWGHFQDEDGNPVAPGDERALELLRKRLIVGSPETCVRECLKYQQELGVTNILARMKFPGLPHDQVLNSIRLWAEKVMPFIQ